MKYQVPLIQGLSISQLLALWNLVVPDKYQTVLQDLKRNGNIKEGNSFELYGEHPIAISKL